jgi:ERCC4-type nuclease
MGYIIDTRELAEHPEIPIRLKTPIDRIELLNAGDYVFFAANNTVCIERCHVMNLVQKLMSGELESQLIRCAEQYGQVILLTEGVYDHVDKYLAVSKMTRSGEGYYRNHVYPSTRYKELANLHARLIQLGCGLINTANFECTLLTLESIYEEWTKSESAHSLFIKTHPFIIPSKLSSNPAVPRLMALVPRLSEKVAIRLINKYGTIWNLVRADTSDVLMVEGFGPVSLKKLKENIGYA